MKEGRDGSSAAFSIGQTQSAHQASMAVRNRFQATAFVEPVAMKRGKTFDLFGEVDVLLSLRRLCGPDRDVVVDRMAHLGEAVGYVLEELVDDLRNPQKVLNLNGVQGLFEFAAPLSELGPSLWGEGTHDVLVIVRHARVGQQEVPDFVGLAGLAGPANLARLALVPTIILAPRRQRGDRKYCASGAYKRVSAVDLVIEPGRMAALVEAI